MRVVVVGASGNLGSALVRRLAEGGHDLVGVSRRPPARAGIFSRVAEWKSVDVGDIGARAELADVFRGADAVVNFAWGFQPTRRPTQLHRTGVIGSANVLTAATAAGVGHLVHTSSVGAYASRADLVPVDETYPTTGVDGSVYSRHKSKAEDILDRWELAHPGEMVVSRLRPGFVLQAAAGAALFRYGLPGWLPGKALDLLPILPLADSFVIPVVHSFDVADAVARILERRAAGAFNLAAEHAVTRDDIGRVLGARPVALSPGVLEALVQATWRAQLQPLDAGWIRLAYSVPLLDSSRARRELGWSAQHDPVAALAEAVRAMRTGSGSDGPVLRTRSVADGVRRLLAEGPVSRRLLP